MRNLRVSVLGGGSWGTTIAHILAARVPVTLWARDRATVAELAEHNTNSRYLPGVALSAKLAVTGDIAAAAAGADVLVFGVPSEAMRETAAAVRDHIRPWVPLISLAKGFESGTDLRMSQVLAQELPGHVRITRQRCPRREYIDRISSKIRQVQIAQQKPTISRWIGSHPAVTGRG